MTTHTRQVRTQFQADHDSINEVLQWALIPADSTVRTIDQFDLGLRLCVALHRPWAVSGRTREAQLWLENGVENSRGPDRAVLAECLGHAAFFIINSEDFIRAEEWATASIKMWRRLGVNVLPWIPLHTLAYVAMDRGDADQARTYLDEAIAGERATGDRVALWQSLGELASLEAAQHNFQRALEVSDETLELADELGGMQYVLDSREARANTLRQLGRVEEAATEMHDLIPKF